NARLDRRAQDGLPSPIALGKLLRLWSSRIFITQQRGDDDFLGSRLGSVNRLRVLDINQLIFAVLIGDAAGHAASFFRIVAEHHLGAGENLSVVADDSINFAHVGKVT